MPCLVAGFAFFFPRIAMVVLYLTGWLPPAFQSTLWPLLGFVFMPYTTLAYASAMNYHGGVSGGWLALVIVGALLDLGATGGSGQAAARQKRHGGV